MKQWEIWTWDFPWGSHPAVIVTPDALLAQPYINVIAASSRRASRLPRLHEIILDEADGLEWPTLCRLAPFWAVEPTRLKQRRGELSSERRREAGNKMIRLFGFWTA